jgi:hypothetical protein
MHIATLVARYAANFTGDQSYIIIIGCKHLSCDTYLQTATVMKKALLGASKRMRGEKSKNKSSSDEKKSASVSSAKENSDGIFPEVSVRVKDHADEGIAVSVTTGAVPSSTREERKRRHKTAHAPTTPSDNITRNGDEDVKMSRAERALQKSTSEKVKIPGERKSKSKRPQVAIKSKLPIDYTTSIVVQIINTPKEQRQSNIITRCYALVFCVDLIR